MLRLSKRLGWIQLGWIKCYQGWACIHPYSEEFVFHSEERIWFCLNFGWRPKAGNPCTKQHQPSYHLTGHCDSLNSTEWFGLALSKLVIFHGQRWHFNLTYHQLEGDLDCFSPWGCKLYQANHRPDAPFLSSAHICAMLANSVGGRGRLAKTVSFLAELSNCTGMWTLALAPLASYVITSAFWQKGGKKKLVPHAISVHVINHSEQQKLFKGIYIGKEIL